MQPFTSDRSSQVSNSESAIADSGNIKCDRAPAATIVVAVALI
ncbi:hypothetical protein [Microseira wollei]|nr:hypothetical protein [Microseira wollei]